MKKTIVGISVLVIFVLGFIAGSTAVIRAPKWVETHGSMYTIVTEFMGNVYTDDAQKESEWFDSIQYTKLNRSCH